MFESKSNLPSASSDNFLSFWRIFIVVVAALLLGAFSAAVYLLWTDFPSSQASRWQNSILLVIALVIFSFALTRSFYRYAYRPIQSSFERITAHLQERDLAYFVPNRFDYLLKSIEYYFDQVLDQLDTKQQLLSESESNYSAILDIQSELVLVLSDSGYIKYCNGAFANFFQAEELLSDLSKDHLAIFSLPKSVAALADEAQSTMREALDSGTPQHYESTLVIDGKECYVSWTIKCITSGDSYEQPEAEFLWVGRDDTQTKMMETRARQLESLATVGRMASTISHEINQPLSVIRLALSNLKDMSEHDSLSKDLAEEKFNQIQFQVERAEKIIRNLKSFNSVTQREVKFELLSINSVLGNIVDEQSLLTAIDNIEFTAEIPPEDIKVRGNITLFEQAIHNLITNSVYALKESEQLPGRHIKLGCRVAGESVQVVLTDNGPGVAADILDKITSPFFSTKPPGKGSGIGLSLCYDIIEKMGGNLTLSNIPTGGFKADITLPRA